MLSKQTAQSSSPSPSQVWAMKPFVSLGSGMGDWHGSLRGICRGVSLTATSTIALLTVEEGMQA
jgi:hypothetical protein